MIADSSKKKLNKKNFFQIFLQKPVLDKIGFSKNYHLLPVQKYNGHEYFRSNSGTERAIQLRFSPVVRRDNGTSFSSILYKTKVF